MRSLITDLETGLSSMFYEMEDENMVTLNIHKPIPPLLEVGNVYIAFNSRIVLITTIPYVSKGTSILFGKESIQQRKPWNLIILFTSSSERTLKTSCMDTGNEQMRDPTTVGNQLSGGPLVKVEMTLEDSVHVETSKTEQSDSQTKAAYEVLIISNQNCYCSYTILIFRTKAMIIPIR